MLIQATWITLAVIMVHKTAGGACITVIMLPAVIMMATEVCGTMHHVIEITAEITATHTAAATTMR